MEHHYIGLDAHSATCTFVCINQKGEQTAKYRTPTSELNIKRFLGSLKGKKSLVFEESTMSKWLHTVIHNEVDELTVCHPGFITKKRGPKNDYRDGLHLAQELRKGYLVSVFHNKDNIYIPIRGLVSNYLDIVSDIVRSKNRLKSLFRSEGIKKVGKTIYSSPEDIKELSCPYNQFSADTLMYQVGMLEEIKTAYVEQLKNNVKKHKILQLLDSIPQVNAIRANIIAAYTCDGQRFKSKHQYWAYIGLVRYDQTSDDKFYGSKKIYGRSELKSTFMGMAEGILHSESSLRKYYDQLRSKGLDHKKAKKSVARRLAAIALAIFKTQKPFDDKFEVKKKRKMTKQKN